MRSSIFRRILNSCVAAALVFAAAVSAAEQESQTLTSDRLNGVHRDLATEIEPVEIGPVLVQLTSPEHKLEVFEHGLELRPDQNGTDVARMHVRFQGQAHLLADVEVGGLPSRFEDLVELPLQETEIEGRIELARAEGGYRVTTVEVPSHVEIEVKSQLGQQFDLLCRGLAAMAWGSVNCDALGESFERLRVPLPEPGRSYFVSSTRLTAEERRQVEAYLDSR